MQKRNLAVSLILTFCLASTIFLVPPHAKAQLITTSLRFDFPDEVGEVDVSPGANGTVIFQGTLECSSEFRMSVSFSIEAQGNDTSDWVVGVSPSQVLLEPGTHPVPVTVFVYVPPETSVLDNGVVAVKAVGTPWGTGAQPTPATENFLIKIKPFYILTVVCATPYKEVAPGSIITFGILLENRGNSADMFEVEVENKETLVENGWTIQSVPLTRINERDSSVIQLTLHTPTEWTMWKDVPQDIKINIKSQTSNKAVEFVLYVRQKGTYIPGFEPALLIIALASTIIILEMRRLKQC